MTVKQWNIGDVITAADLNIWTVPLAVVKPSNQAVTSSIVYVNDTALLLPVAANSIYHVELVLQYTATGGGDIKFAWTPPSGTTGFWAVIDTPAGGGGLSGSAAFSWVTDSYNAQGAGATVQSVRIGGVLNVAGTAGNLQLRWTQNTSNAGATTVLTNSALIAQQIA